MARIFDQGNGNSEVARRSQSKLQYCIYMRMTQQEMRENMPQATHAYWWSEVPYWPCNTNWSWGP